MIFTVSDTKYHHHYLKYVNLGQKANHGGIYEHLAVHDGREKLEGLQDDTDAVPDPQVGRGLHAEDHGVHAVEQA